MHRQSPEHNFTVTVGASAGSALRPTTKNASRTTFKTTEMNFTFEHPIRIWTYNPFKQPRVRNSSREQSEGINLRVVSVPVSLCVFQERARYITGDEMSVVFSHYCAAVSRQRAGLTRN